MEKQKEAFRNLVEKSLRSLESDVDTMLIGFKSCICTMEEYSPSNYKEIIDKNMKIFHEKLEEFETLNSNFHEQFRSKVQKLLESRKEAELMFLEERERFASIISGMENYQQKVKKSLENQYEKEYLFFKEGYFKL